MSVLTPLDDTSLLTAARVDQRLEEFFDDREARAARLGARYAELWRGLRLSARGGKKLRPRLVVEAFGALRDERTQVTDGAVVDVAAAFELLHTAFLLHDDVMDGDVMRRGRPNLIGALVADAEARGVDIARARRWGEASAILGGDLLIHGAHAVVSAAELPAALRVRIDDLLDDAIFRTAEGQHCDVAFACGVGLPDLADLLRMAEGKTAFYTFVDPLRAGALLAGADDELIELLGEYGRATGVAFQLRDDVLGSFGDERVLGKSVTSDRRNGAVTALSSSARGRRDARESAEALIAGNRDVAMRLAASEIVPRRLRAVLEEHAVRATERES